MVLEKINPKYISSTLYWTYVTFFVSIICSFRAISSIAIALILIAGLIKNKKDTGAWMNKNTKNNFLVGCILFFLVQLTTLLHTDYFLDSVKNLQVKIGLVVIPLAVCCCYYVNHAVRKKLMIWYVWILLFAMVYLLLSAYVTYYRTNDTAHFFYHSLVSPFEQHAIQFSMLVFIGVLFLLEAARIGWYLHNRYFIHFFVIIFFIFFLFLLSSKLIIGFMIVYLLYYFLRSARKITASRYLIPVAVTICLLVTSIVLLTRNPISKRFNEIVTGDISLIQQERFHPGIYFNGLQFRLLLWRFVKEILTENKSWIMGIGLAESQIALDKKFISTNMYVGEAQRMDHGFLGYNTHNQFLESLLQTGILGLSVFLFICYSMARMAWLRKNSELSFIVIMLLASAFTEAVFATQYGIILFTFFPLFIYYSLESRTQ